MNSSELLVPATAIGVGINNRSNNGKNLKKSCELHGIGCICFAARGKCMS